MNAQAPSKEDPFPGWKRVLPPPPGYFHVLRRSFGTGLHVLVLVIKTKRGYRVKSCVDQNTLRGLDSTEGRVATFPEVVEIVRKATLQWGDPLHLDGPTKAVPAVPFYYTDKNNKMAGPVTRDELWEIFGAGVIDWNTQVWDGSWVPILEALGFPPVP